jgi:hypothetical protein
VTALAVAGLAGARGLAFLAFFGGVFFFVALTFTLEDIDGELSTIVTASSPTTSSTIASSMASASSSSSSTIRKNNS